MHIGFSINETLCLLTLASGACWWLLRWHQRRQPASGRHPVGLGLAANLFAVIGLMFTCRVALADWPKVPTSSMEPTIRAGDYLLVNHLAYGPRLPFTNTALPLGEPQRGDVVVFRHPLNVSRFYVKRLIGLPGDVVRFEQGVAGVNGEAPAAERLAAGADARDADRGLWLLRETIQQRSHTIKINPFVQGRLPLNPQAPGLAGHCQAESASGWQCTVPAGHYLMLGDNRDDSEDSRVWGFLPQEQVYGKAVRVLVNFSDLSRSWTAL